MNILVTGAAGFLGSHLLRELLATRTNDRIFALDDLSGGYRENLPAGVTFILDSVTNAPKIDYLFDRCRFDVVYHLAAYAAEGLSHFIRNFNYTNNLLGSVNLINAAVKYGTKSFVFTSSIAVYGSSQTPMSETTIPHPEDPYGISKLAVEYDLESAHQMFGLDYVVFRPHNVYGEFQNVADKYRNVVGIFMRQITNSEPMTVFGDGEQMRAFTYAGDIIPAIASSPWVPEATNQVFNIGSDDPHTVNELASAVAIAMGTPLATRNYLPERHEAKLAYSDHAKFNHVFGSRGSTSLPDGLARMAAWVKQVGVRPEVSFSNIELTNNLPPSWRQP